ncbi:MAG TPA: hypothetical protein VGP93_04160 [Polyangiaceae bacterium]|jgi:hypothetical protein|nr:hypothetical protein [Polyangiaceae bacterium]
MISHRRFFFLVSAAGLALACSDSGGSNQSNGSGGSAGTAAGGASGGKAGASASGGSAGTSASGGDSGVAGKAGSAAGGSGAADPFADDTYLPWFGGPDYYATWPSGPPTDPSYFPISVWLQSPANAGRYQDVGIHSFTGLWEGPTEQQLGDLSAANMPTFCDQSGVWQSHLGDATIQGWLLPDEPDNAQSCGVDCYDPCVPPSEIVTQYQTFTTNDPSRPVLLNLGRGVADTGWFGRGDCTGHTEMYADYAQGADILSYDIYPVNEDAPLEIVATGVDNLLEWSGHEKPVVMDIEASNFNDTQRPTPSEIETEVWMALVHGAAGIEYFCHRFKPTFSETDCLDDAPTAAALTAINAELDELAPVLNQPPVGNGVSVASSDQNVPVDVLLKRYGGDSYLFAVAMRGDPTTATFTLERLPAAATAEVLGESRTVPIVDGVFSDDFAGYAVHRYHITVP